MNCTTCKLRFKIHETDKKILQITTEKDTEPPRNHHKGKGRGSKGIRGNRPTHAERDKVTPSASPGESRRNIHEYLSNPDPIGIVVETRMDSNQDDERMKYGQFVELLNTVRSKGLVSAEKRRALDKRWRGEPVNRDIVLEEIERIIEAHSEQQISQGE